MRPVAGLLLAAALVVLPASAASAPAPAEPAPAAKAKAAAPIAPSKSKKSTTSGTPFSGVDSTQPIHISGDDVQADMNAKTVTYSGNVRAEQGKMTLHSAKLVADAPQNRVTKVTATGDVVITSEDATARSPVAVYDVASRTITMSDQVSLTQGGNTLRGTLLVVDLITGTAKLTAGGGRVDGVLIPNSAPPGAGKSKPKPSADKSAKN